jgi:opacity protein-like surface antigen
MKKLLLPLLSVLVLASSLAAQQKTSPDHFATDVFREGGNEYQFWSGYSPDSLTGIGKSEERRVFMAGFGWRRVLLANNSIAWKFTLDTVPIALVSQPTLDGVEVVQDPKRLCGNCSLAIGRRTTFGLGFAPVGFEFNFRRRHRFQPVAGINGGLLHFTRDVPIPHSNNFDFTFSFMGGMQFFTSDARSVMIGYRYHHISNANTGNPFNPGIDSNFIFVGYSFHK